jgi:hypothetical protein
MCLFCLRHKVDQDCHGKGTEKKPACPIPECGGKHSLWLHGLMTIGQVVVNVAECMESEEDEEGCVNIVMRTEGGKARAL